MRDRWYSDKRDLVKWGSLVHLAKAHKLETILQVAFYVADDKNYQLQTRNGTVDFPAVVWEHFRDLDGIKGLSLPSNLHIKVFKEPFVRDTKRKTAKTDFRTEYLKLLLAKIKDLRASRLLVFLDPDTGIAPERPSTKHVNAKEIQDVFVAMKPGDWLVLYQHARRETNWRQKTLKQFARAVGRSVGRIQTFSSPTVQSGQNLPLAHDVILFAVGKT